MRKAPERGFFFIGADKSLLLGLLFPSWTPLYPKLHASVVSSSESISKV